MFPRSQSMGMIDLLSQISIEYILAHSFFNSDELKEDKSVVLDIEKVKCCENKEEKCSICMENIKEGEHMSELSCKHLFHEECIQHWGRMKQECPLCRTVIKRK
jgi:hypothetical protein